MDYGGSSPRSTNILFVNGKNDPWNSISVINSEPHLNIFTNIISNASHSTDLTSNIDSNQENNILKIIERWIKVDHLKCHNGGIKILDECKCTSNFGGKYCEFSKRRFRCISVLSVLTPTVLLLIIGLTVCLSEKGSELMNEFGNRPKLYLYV